MSAALGDQTRLELVWQLEARRLLDARRSLELITRQWDRRLERLRPLVEG